jgi:hypothetical protein
LGGLYDRAEPCEYVEFSNPPCRASAGRCERTISWLTGYHRLNIRYDRKAGHDVARPWPRHHALRRVGAARSALRRNALLCAPVSENH